MDLKKPIITLFIVLVSLSLYAQPPAENAEALSALLPTMKENSTWYQDGEPHYFDGDNLFEYINGSADMYLAYDFRELITITFLNDDYQSLTIDIYDMGNSLSAFGVYSNFWSPDDISAALGTDAIVSDYYIRFYHGQYVVDLNASDSNKEIKNLMLGVAGEIENKIDANKAYPDVLQLLPEDGLIHRTEKYISQALLGHNFLPKGLEAKYMVDEAEVKAFITLCDSIAEAEMAETSLRDYITARGEQLEAVNFESISATAGKMPYHGTIVFARHDSLLYGIIDLPSADAGQPLMQEIKNALITY